MSEIDSLIEADRTYAASYPPGISGVPSRHVAVVTCMDCRIDPAQALGLNLGEANVIRNAGGLVTDDAIRSLAVSQHKLDTTAVMIIQHTKCGLTTYDDDDFRAELEADTGVRPPWSSEPFGAAQDNVRAALRALRSSPFLPHREDIRGFVFDVDSGLVHEVTD